MLLSLSQPAEDWLDRATAALRDSPPPCGPPTLTAQDLVRRSGEPPQKPRPPRGGPVILLLRRLRIPATVLAAAAILLAIVFWPGGGAGTALAQAVQNFISARVLELAYANYEGDQQTAAGKVFVVGDQMERIELDDGRVIITDHDQDRSLTLLPDQRRAVLSEAITSWTGILDQLRAILLEPAEELPGEHVLDGESVRVYRLTSANQTTVSVRPGAELPAQIVYALPASPGGDPGRTVLRVIATSATFDPSRFDLAPPKGYSLVEQVGDTRALTAKRLMKLGQALFSYANDHGDTFPPDLATLASYLDAENASASPDRQAFSADFVYVRPVQPTSPRMLLAYEKFTDWDSGINVLFGDGHTEFITDRNQFDKLLAATLSPPRD